MTLAFIGYTFDVIGKLLIAGVTLRLHVKHFQKHHVNKEDVKLDAWLSTLGIILIAVGYVLHSPVEWGQV